MQTVHPTPLSPSDAAMQAIVQKWDDERMSTEVQEWEFERLRQMSGRRFGAAGIRRGARSDAAIVKTVESIGGAALVYWYRGDNFVVGGGGAPDVGTVTQPVFTGRNTDYNLTQATADEQPHSGTVNSLQGFVFDGTDDNIQNAVTGTPRLCAVGDEVDIFFVMKYTASGAAIMEYANTAGSQTQTMAASRQGSGIRTLYKTVTAGALQIDTGVLSTTATLVIRMSLRDAWIETPVDGTVQSRTITTTGGVTHAIGQHSLGALGSGSFPAPGTHFQGCMLVNATTAVVAEMETYLIANPGVA